MKLLLLLILLIIGFCTNSFATHHTSTNDYSRGESSACVDRGKYFN